MFYVLSFFYGAAIGSFVQVVATRLNVAPVMKSRSKCLSCGEALRASDLVPIFSFLFLKGKCRYCKSPYGISALLIEVLFGTIFVLLYEHMLAGVPLVSALWWLLYYSLLFISLGVLTLYDLRHSYVPLPYLSLFSFLSLGMLAMRLGSEASIATLLGPLVVAFPFLLIWVLTKGKALGFGDVVLYLAVGAFFGIEQGLAVLLLSVWLGAIVGIGLYAFRRNKGRASSAMPFVPFIVLSFLIVLFTDIDVFSLASVFAR